METSVREAAMATDCLQKINISTAMAAFGKTIFISFDEFQPFLNQIQDTIPSYAVMPFTSIMKVLFRKRAFLVNINNISRSEKTFRCNMTFSYKGTFTGEIHFLAQKFIQVRKIRSPSYPYCQRIFIPHKFIYIAVEYRRVGIEKSSKRKVLSFRSYPMSGRSPTRKHNQQPRYRKFMTSVISSMFIDNSNDATEYVMDQ